MKKPEHPKRPKVSRRRPLPSKRPPGKRAKRVPEFRAFFAGDEPIIVDSFAGGGGASSGVSAALRSLGWVKTSPDIAINHDAEAIAMHRANHPETKHYIEDVWNVDPVKATGGRRVGLAWFSPTCTHFSKAKGTALDASSIKLRGLAWVAVRWAAAVQVDVICLENVEEFLKWGPLHRTHTDGCTGARKECRKGCKLHKPIKAKEGQLFRAFVRRLELLGYKVEWRILRACDFGAPTTRRRLFLVARRDGKQIVWPEATHAAKPSESMKPYRTAAECIDWTIPCPSIFERDRPLADKTLARIARGIQKFVLDNPRPFIVPVAYGGGASRSNSADEPLRTICGNRGGHAVVTPVLVPATHGDSGGAPDGRTHSVEEPMRTLTTRGAQFNIVTPLLVRTAHGDVDKNGKRRGQGSHAVEQPIGTICAGGGDFAIAVPYLVHRSNGERNATATSAAQAPRIYDVEKPLGTIVAQGQKHAAVVALLIKHNGGNNDASGSSGQVLERPIDTVSCKDTKALTVAHLVKLRGTSKAHVDSSAQSVEEPMPTVTASGTHVAAVSAFLVRYNGKSEAQKVDRPAGTLTTKDRYSLVTVTIAGEQYVVADIGMRMLSARELYNAQGFDRAYKIDCPGPTGKPLTKTAQIRMVGNSVPPVMAEVIARAQLLASAT